MASWFSKLVAKPQKPSNDSHVQAPTEPSSAEVSGRSGAFENPTSSCRFSVVVPAFKTPSAILTRTIQSILNQTYRPAEIIIIDDSGGQSEVGSTIASFGNDRAIIKLIANERNVGISAATNKGVQEASGDFILFIDHDDEVTPDAFRVFAEYIDRDPEIDAWYSDQCTVTEAGSIQHHFLKPDWSPTYILGAMYVGHLLAVRSSICKQISFLSEYDGVQDFEFLLRLKETTRRIGHIPKVLYKWRAIEGSLALHGDAKSGITRLQVEAVNEHLQRAGRTWLASAHERLPHRVVLSPSRKSQEPRISIIIPSKNQGEVLKRCLESIFTMTDYDDYEVVLVDNRTTDPVAVAQFDRFPITRVIYRDKTFNYSRANNMGVSEATGELLLFLNNDTEVVDSDWLSKMAMFFEDPEIGAVGATLLYPNRTVQHAGVLLGPRGTADHIMRGLPEGSDGYGGSLCVAREVSAVTAACLMMRKSTFDEIGGFSTDYDKHYQDVDLCMRIREQQKRIVTLGNVRLLHHESLSRKSEGYDLGDRAILIDRWRSRIEAPDPYYNPGFVTGSTDYALRPDWIG